MKIEKPRAVKLLGVFWILAGLGLALMSIWFALALSMAHGETSLITPWLAITLPLLSFLILKCLIRFLRGGSIACSRILVSVATVLTLSYAIVYFRTADSYTLTYILPIIIGLSVIAIHQNKLVKDYCLLTLPSEVSQNRTACAPRTKKVK